MADPGQDPFYDMSSKARAKRWIMRVINTRYLFIAIIVHVVALAIFGGTIIFDAIQEKGMFDTNEVVIGKGDNAPPPPPSGAPTQENFDVKVSTVPHKAVQTLSVDKLNSEFSVPPPVVDVVIADNLKIKTESSVMPNMGNDGALLNGARGFLGGGVHGKGNKAGPTGTGKGLEAKFDCYVLQYDGGDWNCNFGETDGETWYQNCFFNLMLQIERWTQGRVKANLKTEPLRLSSREWIEKVKPPFVFMTGHKDFVFSQQEVKNLQDYLMLGGVLWVDNSLPGRRSRFDMALRRELKKVVPDRDFEALPNTHPLFESYFQFKGPPKGMNSYEEPVEVINIIAGEIAVIYTLNAYSDMWETGLTLIDDIDMRRIRSEKLSKYFECYGPHIFLPKDQYPGYGTGQGNEKTPPYRPWPLYGFFGNVNKESILNSYKFGINVVFHLLTRFQDEFRSLPSG